MRAYVTTTGLLFVALVLAHIWRLTVEPELAHDPIFWSFTVLAAAMGLWAWRVLRLWPWRSAK
jgi:hypothetical protein